MATLQARATMDRQALLEHLRRHRMLRLIAKDDLERLIISAQYKALSARSRLFATGDAGHAFYIVLSGWVKLSREGPGGRDIILEVAGEGTLFGELAVLSRLPRAADASALVPTRLLSVDGRALLSTLRQNPDASLELIRILGERLVRTTAQMEDSLFLPADKRLARALLKLAALDGHASPTGLQIDLGLSQKELGELTGLSRESTNKQLSLWRDSGLVRMEDRTLTLIDGLAFASLADQANWDRAGSYA